MTVSEPSGAGSAVDRRLRALPFSERGAILIVAGLLILLVDSEALALIPLLGVLADDYDLSAAQAAWAVSATAISTAAFVPVLSRLGDFVGIRRVLLFSLAMVVVGNFLTVVATGPTLLVLGRLIVGLNAATTLLYVLLRLRSHNEKAVDSNVGFMTAFIGGGVAVAFLLSGVVIQLGGTARTVLEVMTVLSVAVLILGWLYIPDSVVRIRVRIDYLGSILMGVGLGLLVVGVGQGNAWGWLSLPTIGVVGLGGLLLILWGWWELRAPEPLIDLRIVARREVWPAFAASGVAAILGNASAVTISHFVQAAPESGYGFGASVLVAGLFLVPIGLTIAIGGSFMQPVIGRLGQRRAAALGGIVGVVGFVWYAFNYDRPWQAAAVMILVGISYALTFTAAASAYLRVARAGEGGMLTGAGRIASTGISAFGPAVVTAILETSIPTGAKLPTAGGYTAVWLFLGFCSLLMFLFSLLIRNSRVDTTLAPKARIIGEGPTSSRRAVR